MHAVEVGTVEGNIVLASAFGHTGPAVYTAYPPVSGPCIVEGRERKEEIRKFRRSVLAYEHLVAFGRRLEPWGCSADEDCEVLDFAETVACQADMAPIQRECGNYLGQGRSGYIRAQR